jgi:glycosyltransferase involved in cell wall biosynthesis
MYNAVDIDNIIHLSNLSIGNYKNIFNNWKTTFINVARLNYQKNQALLIEAFNKIDNKNTQLIIIWEGNERNNLEKLIVKLWLEDRVLLLWNQENTYSFINLADYWILSSRFEWFPMVLIEAWVLWKTILSLDCPTWPREFLDPFYQLWEIKESYTKSQNWILIRFDESNTIHLTKTMNDIQKMDTTIFQQNVKEYCKSFDLLNYGEKRNIIIQSLV